MKFIQHCIGKISGGNGNAQGLGQSELEWCSPGYGDSSFHHLGICSLDALRWWGSKSFFISLLPIPLSARPPVRLCSIWRIRRTVHDEVAKRTPAGVAAETRPRAV